MSVEIILSIIKGSDCFFDLENTLAELNEKVSGTEADLRALQADWSAIGEDMKKAIVIYEKEKNTCSKPS